MKRLLALLLVLGMLLVPLAACGGRTEDGPASPSAEAEPEEIVLPSALTLKGTVHMPPIGNQGGIGCCTSMGVTYMQFTIAVSQYLHALDPDIEWDPSSGNTAYIFSPKFTYNLSGAGTAYAYDVLKDHGSLTVKDTFFETDQNGAPTKTDKAGRLSKKTMSWNVNEGELEKALRYRLLNYEEIENTSMQLSSDAPLVKKIKEALYKGNGVAFSCWSSNWRTANIDRNGTGTYGEKNDLVVYTAIDNTAFTGSKEDASGNHCVCIVGYDDDITLTVAGVKMKGAFQIANSWGSKWGNDGFVWMMYDAFNTKSEYDILNDGEFYSSTKHLTPTQNGVKLRTAEKGGAEQMLTFKKIEGEENSTVELKGKSYPLYTVSAEESGVLTVGKDGSLLCDAAEGAKGGAIAVIPYKDAAAWSGAKADDEEYGESYLLYSADSGAGTDGKAFIAMTSSSGAGLAAFSGSSGEKKCCFELSKYKASAKHFTCRASLVSSKGQTGKRTATGYRFSFIYWDKDITYGVPGAMVEVELASNKRNSVKLTVGRIDATGSKVERVPAMFRYNVDGTNHVYSDKAESLTFSGKKSTDSTVETAYFTVGLNEMAKLVEGFENDAFLWTVDVAGNGAKVKKIRMKDGEGNLLFETAIPDSYPTLGKGEKYSFVIDLGGELKEYSAEPSGVQRIVNKESGLYLTKQKMAVVLQEKPTDDGKFEIKYDSLQGYSLYAEKTKYLLDITGKEITEGVEIKLNAPFDTRDTQNFDLLRQKDGCFQIALRADPSYILTAGEDGKVVLAKADTAGQSALWKFVEREEGDGIPSSVKAENGTVTYTALLPKNVDGAPTVYVTDAEGKEIFKGKAEKSGEKLSVSFPAPEKGNYLIRTEIGGKPAGVQTLYTVK